MGKMLTKSIHNGFWEREVMRMERKQITLRLPDKVYEALRAEAKEKGLTVNDLILLRINPLQVNFRDSHFSLNTVSG